MAFFLGFAIGVIVTIFLTFMLWAFLLDHKQNKKIDAYLKKHLGAKKFEYYQKMLSSPAVLMWRSLK